MRNRRLLWNFGLVVLFIGGVFTTLVLLVLRQPSFYTQAEIPAGSDRELASRKALAEAVRITDTFGKEPLWQVEFTTQEINAFFQEDYYAVGGDDNLPAGFSAPRIKIEDGRLRFGVRYQNGPLSTILSVELKVWLVASDANMLAMEVVSLNAGSLPLSPSTLLDYISQAARAQNIEVTWYRNEGHPVAIMRFQAELTRPTFVFEQIELSEGKIFIAGRATDATLPDATNK